MRILLTVPVTVASGERSFSKLKLIKTYLRSTMLQSRLSSLGTLSIENEIAENLDFSVLIKDFADKKARKANFLSRILIKLSFKFYLWFVNFQSKIFKVSTLDTIHMFFCTNYNKANIFILKSISFS